MSAHSPSSNAEKLAVDGLPTVRMMIEKYGLNARKELGQNFLFDLSLTERIARTAGDLREHTIVEVGPGPGGLTRALLANGAKKVIAIERDARALPLLAEIAAHHPGRLEVLEADALEVDVATLAEGKIRIVANLPYNVATPLLTNWIGTQDWPPAFESLTLMFQKEVAQRICAAPGGKAYGRLSVLSGWRTHARKAFDVSAAAFSPPPKVTSSIVHLEPKPDAEAVPVADLENVTRAAFGQRRKMLRQSLKALGVDVETLLAKNGLAGTERAENISVAQFIALAKTYGSMRSN